VLLVTSNYPPEGLLPNPLYHARFKPVIDLINARMQVMEVGGPHDYRSQASNHAHQVFTKAIMCGRPQRAPAPGAESPPEDASHGSAGRQPLHSGTPVRGSPVAFTFNDLCEQPTAVMDYLELCRRFDHWIIDDLPELDERSIAAQQRFINLIDVLYDQDKH
jgi:cell division protein ZapE